MSTTLLLTHLQNSNPNVPLETIIAALAHHLAVDLPVPTPLAASAISSPYFLLAPLRNERLQGLVTAFRHASHLKHQALVKTTENGWSLSRAVFSKGVEAGTKEWVRAVLRGLQGGRAVIRLACCTGLLLGINGLGMSDGKAEDEVIIALAEVMDDYNADTGDWEKEFRPKLDETLLSLTLILASQSLPSITTTKLKALPMSLLARLLTSTIASAFQEGNFMRDTLNPSFDHAIQVMSTAPTMLALAGLSKSMALTLEILIETSSGGLQDAYDTLHIFQIMASRIEKNWRVSETTPTSEPVWLLLKNFLFSTIMIADRILGAAVYVRPGSPSKVAPHMLAISILRTLSHLSFVVSQFGGVTATAVSDDPGFMELRKVFYLALDVLSTQQQSGASNDCESFVKELVADLGIDTFTPGDTASRHLGTLQQAKTAYTLACIEQLITSLGIPCLKDYVWDLCIPYLSDPSHREIYESAHSVVLSIFSSHAQHQPVQFLESGTEVDPRRRLTITSEAKDETRVSRQATLDPSAFVHRMVPFYAQCLIENSQDGRLSTAQLRLAYAALVRCASTSGTNGEAPQLAWYCISLILDMIRGLSSEGAQEERLHRLNLTLISTVSSLPLPFMIRALEEIRSIITIRQQSDNGVEPVEDVEKERRRKELVDSLFAEILEKVGDQEKEAAMRWWYAHRQHIMEDAGMKAQEGLGRDVVSRL
ncbi:hypothetical protein C0991_012270 [Blastosporella zonata]|nr:hypothetical protein C0991_012270 [Blastosporella zonata]